MELGLFVLCNPGPGERWPTAAFRAEEERKFFSSGGWSTLPGSMCGAASLSKALSSQLQQHIASHMGCLRDQVQSELNECERRLGNLPQGFEDVDLIERILTR